ncbi:MAG: hypothetical protein J6T10_20025 [Methanobrevibacter sp.]|nr:hypothetical protein [Methanobrevibacter sp.]
MIDYKDSVLNIVYDEDEYIRFVEFGRIRKIAKSIDARSLTVERNNHVIVQLSTGQQVDCTKYFGMKDDVVRNWLTVLYFIGR